MFWHEDINPKFNAYLDSDEYRVNSDKAIRAYFKGNPVMMLGLYKLFPEMFLEQVKRLSYYSNLGLFWEVMAPVFFDNERFFMMKVSSPAFLKRWTFW